MDDSDCNEPSSAISISLDDFLFALQVGMAASSLRMPMENPAAYGFTIEAEDGHAVRMQLTDDPLNRFGLAVRQHFDGDHARFKSFMRRWFALQAILELPQCGPYIRRNPGESSKLIHSSVLSAAATQPLNDDWEFDPDQFFSCVAELYAADPD